MNIEGEQFQGEFIGDRINYDYWAGSEYTEAKYYVTRFVGTALVEKRGGKRIVFHFQTAEYDQSGRSPEDLQHALIDYSQYLWHPHDLIPVVVEGHYAKVVDLVLGQMYEEAKNSDRAIPVVQSLPLSVPRLIDKGLVEMRQLTH